MTKEHSPIEDDSQSSVRQFEDLVLTKLKIRRERWEIRRIQLRILVLFAMLLSSLLVIVTTLVR